MLEETQKTVLQEYSACVYLDLDQKRFYFAHKVTTKTCRNNRHFFNISIGKNLVTSKQNNVSLLF